MTPSRIGGRSRRGVAGEHGPVRCLLAAAGPEFWNNTSVDLNIMDTLTTRLALRAAGFSPVALNGKRPLLPAWQTLGDADEGEIGKWPGGNSGILTAHTPALDLDILNADAAGYAEDLAREEMAARGMVLVRYGLRPKRAILFRTDVPFPKILRRLKAPDGTTHNIEFLGDGQQVVVAGTHPDTGHPYVWDEYAPWDIAYEDLPEITEAEAEELVDIIVRGLSFRLRLHFRG